MSIVWEETTSTLHLSTVQQSKHVHSVNLKQTRNFIFSIFWGGSGSGDGGSSGGLPGLLVVVVR